MGRDEMLVQAYDLICEVIKNKDLLIPLFGTNKTNEMTVEAIAWIIKNTEDKLDELLL